MMKEMGRGERHDRGDDAVSLGEETVAQHQSGVVYGPFIRPDHSRWERLARRTAHWGLITVGQATHRARMLPGFLIVGAERCGTSFMYHVLRQHPAVFGSSAPRKEVHYFDLAYDRGLAWYQGHFPLWARAPNRSRFRGGSSGVRGNPGLHVPSAVSRTDPPRSAGR